jgi:hypothetical protein
MQVDNIAMLNRVTCRAQPNQIIKPLSPDALVCQMMNVIYRGILAPLAYPIVAIYHRFSLLGPLARQDVAVVHRAPLALVLRAMLFDQAPIAISQVTVDRAGLIAVEKLQRKLLRDRIGVRRSASLALQIVLMPSVFTL